LDRFKIDSSIAPEGRDRVADRFKIDGVIGSRIVSKSTAGSV
jgi:hypothetical protein